ncbi:TetR/AcrR family transcriptional regulator [Dellaglioa sp. P0083]|uniref:TetR/AcrR family transcriptional regulator n=1 Tax=Dellaglioa kimchii TaxID=3344667 RepID=UPI0038D46449
MTENNQAKLSKNLIIDSLIELLKIKSYQEITITEITKKAGVARLTFYRNFENKDAILLTRSDYLFDQFYAELKSNQAEISLKNIFKLAFNYWHNDSEFMDILIKNDIVYLLEDSFYTYFEKILKDTPSISRLNNTQKTFILGGVLRTMLQWISSGSPATAEEVTADILELIQ